MTRLSGCAAEHEGAAWTAPNPNTKLWRTLNEHRKWLALVSSAETVAWSVSLPRSLVARAQ